MTRRAGRPPRSSQLNVCLNGELVGFLNRAAGGAVAFQYADSWLNNENAILVSLSMPLRQQPYSGDIVSSVFENLLPENIDVKRRIAERVGARGTDAFNLLEKIGRDCVGALQFLPADEEPSPPAAPQGERLSDSQIAERIRNLAIAPLGIGFDEGAMPRISIAGVQEKMALLSDGFWREPSGVTPTTHILKPQIGQWGGMDLSQSVENEHYCMTLLQELGMAVAETSIEDFEDQRVLCVKRFDRRFTSDRRLMRLPQEDFCQALSVPPTLKYDQDGGPSARDCLELLASSDEAETDRDEFMTAQILFWLMGATDGHAKNYSLFLFPGGRVRMTPIYDVISLQPLYDSGRMQRRDSRMAMAIGNSRHYRMHDIWPRHFEQLASSVNMSERVVDDIFEKTRDRLPGALERTAERMPRDFPQQIAESVGGAVVERLGRW